MAKNCDRRISGAFGKPRKNLRLHQTHPEIASFHKELWWYGFSMDDGYLYRPEKNQEPPSYSLMDKKSELDLH